MNALVAMWRDEDAAYAARVDDGEKSTRQSFRRRHGRGCVKVVDVEEARRLLGNYLDLKQAGKAP